MSFHVPDHARIRLGRLGSDDRAGNNGAFWLPSPEPGWRLFLLCSDGSECPDVDAWQWEHVSVHAVRDHKDRTPTWKEMAFIKSVCWDDDDVVVQFHPRRSEYVNLHPCTLHLWRPRLATIPTPPPELVGPLDETP